MEPEDDAREVEAGDYNVGGNNPGDEDDGSYPPGNEYLSNFQSSSTLGTGRTDISGISTFHYDSGFPRIVASAGINTSWWYAGVGVTPDATDTSKTGSDGATRCVEIANEISTLISEIQTLRSQRDAAVGGGDRININAVKEKKMDKELQSWGAENVKSKQTQRKSSYSSAISALELLN